MEQLPDPRAPRPAGVRAFTLVLVALLLSAVFLARTSRPEPVLVSVAQNGPPPVVEPTGVLAEVFEVAREASVRIEAFCEGATRRGNPLGIGSGFFISDDGLLLTAYHVVDPSNTRSLCPVDFSALSPSGDRFSVSLVGFDAYLDLALLRADVGASVAYVPLSESVPRPGTSVVAIGNSRGDFLEGRSGRVTRLGVQAGRADFATDAIEMTAAVAPGDSGGPVLNDRGEVIGVVSYISFRPDTMSSESDTFVPPFLRGIAFPTEFASYAVPITTDSDVMLALLAGEQRDVPVIGFSWQPGFDYDPALFDIDLGRLPGPIVVTVQAGGPADLAGLRSLEQRPVLGGDGRQTGQVVNADVIVAVDSERTPTFNALLEVIRRRRIGDTVLVTVQRGRETVELEMTLGAKRTVFSN